MKRFPIALFAASIAFAQFIPDKTVTIHPAVVMKAETQGSIKGPGAGLGSTPPAPIPAGRGGGGRGRGGTPPPIPPPPAAPKIGAAGAAVEQRAQGTRA